MFNASESNPLKTSDMNRFLDSPTVKNAFQKNLPQISCLRAPESVKKHASYFESHLQSNNSNESANFDQNATLIERKAETQPILQENFQLEPENNGPQPKAMNADVISEKMERASNKFEINALISKLSQLQNNHHTSDSSPMLNENQIFDLEENTLFSNKVKGFGDHQKTVKSAMLPSFRDRTFPTKSRTLNLDSSEVSDFELDRGNGNGGLMQSIFQNLRNSDYGCKTVRPLDKSNHNFVKQPSEIPCGIIKTEKRHFSGKLNVQQIGSDATEKRGFCKNLFAKHFSNDDEDEVEVENERSLTLLQGPAKKLFMDSPGLRFCQQLSGSNASTALNSLNPSNRNSNDVITPPQFLQSSSIGAELFEEEPKFSQPKPHLMLNEDKVIPSPTLASQDVHSFLPERTFLSSVCMLKDSKIQPGTSPRIGSYLNVDLKSSPSKNSLSELPESSRFSVGYEKCEELGRGTFGKVYRCIGRIDGAEYAVKVIPQRSRGISRVDRALNEIQIHAAVSQNEESYFSRYYNSWAEDGNFYLVMEYCPCNLTKMVTMGTKMTEPVIRNVLRDVCLGLQQLHRMNYAHLDIKPDNILYSKDGKYKITDLGLARIADRNPNEDVDEGDQRYFAPEFLNDFKGVTQTASVLTKADICSLGVTIYELMIGEEMPKGGDEWHNIRGGILPKLDNLQNYSDSLKAMVRLMLSADPLSRPSADEILSRLLPDSMTLEIQGEKAEKVLIKSQMMETEAAQQNSRKYTA